MCLFIAPKEYLIVESFMFNQGRSGIIIVGWLASQKDPVQGVADNFEPWLIITGSSKSRAVMQSVAP